MKEFIINLGNKIEKHWKGIAFLLFIALLVLVEKYTKFPSLLLVVLLFVWISIYRTIKHYSNTILNSRLSKKIKISKLLRKIYESKVAKIFIRHLNFERFISFVGTLSVGGSIAWHYAFLNEELLPYLAKSLTCAFLGLCQLLSSTGECTWFDITKENCELQVCQEKATEQEAKIGRLGQENLNLNREIESLKNENYGLVLYQDLREQKVKASQLQNEVLDAKSKNFQKDFMMVIHEMLHKHKKITDEVYGKDLLNPNSDKMQRLKKDVCQLFNKYRSSDFYDLKCEAINQ